MSRREYRGSYECNGSDGRIRTVKNFVSVDVVGLRSDGVTTDGVSELHCEGEIVTRLEKGHYQSVAGLHLKTDDPGAP